MADFSLSRGEFGAPAPRGGILGTIIGGDNAIAFYQFVDLKIEKKAVEEAISAGVKRLGLIGGFVLDKLGVFGVPLNTIEAEQERLLLEWAKGEQSQGAFATGRAAVQFADP